jgi:hypothetical protein
MPRLAVLERFCAADIAFILRRSRRMIAVATSAGVFD